MIGFAKPLLILLGALLIAFGSWWLWDSREDAKAAARAALKEQQRLEDLLEGNQRELERLKKANALAKTAAQNLQKQADILRLRNAALTKEVQDAEDGPLSPGLHALNQRLLERAKGEDTN